MLSELTSEKLMKLNIDAKDWKDAVRQAAEPLYREGKIEERYIDAIIQSAEEAGPYFVITPHVALPHARPEMGAVSCAIGVATLVNPVKFGNEDNDPVKYLFCLSATDNESHLSALVDLAGLLENQDFYKFLDNAKTPEEIMKYLKREQLVEELEGENIMYKALVCCRAGMGSSMLLKIKADQVIKENNLPIQTEHGNLDSIIGFNGDLVITMEDLTAELSKKVKYALGVRNIMDKEEIKTKLEEFLATKEA